MPLVVIDNGRGPVAEIAKRSFSILGRLIEGAGVENRHVALADRLVIRPTCAKLTNK